MVHTHGVVFMGMHLGPQLTPGWQLFPPVKLNLTVTAYKHFPVWSSYLRSTFSRVFLSHHNKNIYYLFLCLYLTSQCNKPFHRPIGL